MMQLKPADFKVLRLPVAVLVAAVVAAGVMLLASGRYLAALEESDGQISQRLTAARVKLVRTRLEEDNFRSYYKTFQELQRRGLVGMEHRLDWIEHLATLQQRYHLYSVDYALAPQRPYARIATNQGRTLNASASRIRVSVGALHEGDLVDFLGDLQHDAPGVFVIESCNLRRAALSVTLTAGPNLNAECSLDWVTVRENGQ